MLGTLDHEIGTHFLRSYNEKNQIWHKKREQCSMQYCIATEEGLASVNQLVRTVSQLSLLDFVLVSRRGISTSGRSCSETQ